MPTQYIRHVFVVRKKDTQKLISVKFVWHNLKKDVNQCATQCFSYQSSMIPKHVHAPLDTFVVPRKRFSHINIVMRHASPPASICWI